jgi:hypothetical protein
MSCGRVCYTWCSLDAIFLPRLLGKKAEVESTCSETGREFHLTVTPDGIADYSPASTVLSNTVPGLACRCEDDADDKPENGPSSDSCSQMFFFCIGRRAGQQGTFANRRAKVRLAGIDWTMIEKVNQAENGVLVARHEETGRSGASVTATVPLLDGGWHRQV